MDVKPPQELKIGRIIEETLNVIERCAVPAVIFIVALTLLNGSLAYFGLNYTAITQELAKGLIGFVIAVGAAYLLFETMLRKHGFLDRTSGDVILPYAGLSILYTLAVGIGLLLIIFPGLFFMARWSVAQPLLIARGQGVIEAMKESWERTKGSEFAILVVVVILIIVPAALSYFIGTRFDPDNPVGIGLAQFISAASSMIGIAMGVALYRLIIVDRDGGAAKTFE